MINQAPYIRQALYALLNGAVIYGGEAVPVYDNGGKAKLKYQILIQEMDSNNEGTKHSITERWQQVIEVVAEQRTAARIHVDAIGNEVINRMKPAPRTTGINLDSQFQLLNVKKEGQRYITDYGQDGTFIVRLVIRFSFLINQINPNN